MLIVCYCFSTILIACARFVKFIMHGHLLLIWLRSKNVLVCMSFNFYSFENKSYIRRDLL